MATSNDITGDSLRSRPASKQYSEGYSGIDWSVKLDTTKTNGDDAEVTSDKPMCPKIIPVSHSLSKELT